MLNTTTTFPFYEAPISLLPKNISDVVKDIKLRKKIT